MELIKHLVIPGQPKAQMRHRHSGKMTYDPSADYKYSFKCLAYNSKPNVPYDFPISLSLFFNFSRPKSHYGTGKNSTLLKSSAPFFHTSKPDTDNLAKFVTDALNGVFWRDDSIISRMVLEKRYTDNTPSTEITIYKL